MLISTIIEAMRKVALPVEPGVLSSACYSFALRRAARAVSRQYDEVFAPLGLNNGQFTMLALLAGLGSVRIQKMADVLVMDRTTVTAALKPLRRRKLVRVGVAKDDARARDAVLTPAGEAVLRDAIPLWQAQQRVLSKLFSAQEARSLRAQLRRLA